MSEAQSAADVLMIRPARFAGNPQTAASNRFQREPDGADVHANALAEFETLATALEHAGVGVHIFDDTADPHTPDAIFPNNWVSFHADGSAVLYPMLAQNRRRERRSDLLERLSQEQGFRIRRVVDLTGHECNGKFLEGTGSLVLDRANRVAYACLSPRTDLDVLGDFAQQLDYDIVAFEACDSTGTSIYHTNVLMAVGERFAAICTASIRHDERAGVLDALRTTGHTIVDLSLDQMSAFAGNMLELRTRSGGATVAMSQVAFDSLTQEQRETLRSCSGPIVAAAVPTIEHHGGGSVRCMLAEVHLPRR